jgi:lipopolysaccharide/colanic/teichoic acid biosynthesis glycosyltransferase
MERVFKGVKMKGKRAAGTMFFSDSAFMHHQVRVGKKKPSGKHTAIVVSKIRTMKGGAHGDYHKNDKRHLHVTPLGKLLRKSKLDELPQVISVLKGDLAPVGMRPLPRQDYRMLSPELKKIYDDVGPGLLGIGYACKSPKPTEKEFMETTREFYKMWKQNKAKAYLVFGRRIMKNAFGREIGKEHYIQQ